MPISYIGTKPQVAYDQGVADEALVASGQPALHATDNPDQFWYETGRSHKRGGFPLIPWPLVTRAALTVEERNWYLEGFARGVDIANGRKPAAPTGPQGDASYNEFLTAGTYDGQEQKYTARYVITTEPRTAKDYGPKRGSDSVVVLPPPPNAPPPAYRGAPVYEVAAYVLNKLVPLDRLLTVSRFAEETVKNPLYRALWLASIKFEVLGDAPGESREGYRLSGPTGPVARWLANLATQPTPPFPLDPNYYGLPAWYVTRTVGGSRRGSVRFLSKRELLDLGIDPFDSVQFP